MKRALIIAAFAPLLLLLACEERAPTEPDPAQSDAPVFKPGDPIAKGIKYVYGAPYFACDDSQFPTDCTGGLNSITFDQADPVGTVMQVWVSCVEFDHILYGEWSMYWDTVLDNKADVSKLHVIMNRSTGDGWNFRIMNSDVLSGPVRVAFGGACGSDTEYMPPQ